MSIQIPFTKTINERLFGSLIFLLKDKSLIDKFEFEMKNFELECSDFPSIDGKQRFFIKIFQDEFNDTKSKGLMKIISNYAKEITIRL